MKRFAMNRPAPKYLNTCIATVLAVTASAWALPAMAMACPIRIATSSAPQTGK